MTDVTVSSDGAPADSAPEQSTVPARAGLVLGSLIAVAAVANLGLAVANVALPAIGKEFDASQTALNLVAVGYSLGLAASVLYFGAVGDRYGRKLLLILGMVVTVPADCLAAWAPNMSFDVMAQHSLDFWLGSEDLPAPDNRVTLNAQGDIVLALNPKNMEASKRLQGKLTGMLGDLGCRPHLLHHATPLPVAARREPPMCAVSRQARERRRAGVKPGVKPGV